VPCCALQIQTLDIPGEVKAGYSPIGFVRCGRAACKITKINWKVRLLSISVGQQRLWLSVVKEVRLQLLRFPVGATVYVCLCNICVTAVICAGAAVHFSTAPPC
jgi:hypothetical protein